jgi:hypothetical protein
VSSERDRLLVLYRERVAEYGELREDWLRWCRMVLANGGDLVVPPDPPDPDLDRLLEGATVQGPPARSLRRDGDCHAHVAGLWIDGDLDAVGTGYALSDELWRQHSWGVGHDGSLVETKWAYERYIGLTLPRGEPTVRFVLNNYAGDVKEVLRGGSERAQEIIRVLRDSRARRTR